MDINILTPSASPVSAVGNDTLGMADALQSNGYDVHVYAGDWNSCGVSSALPLDAYRKGSMSSNIGVLIYHHAIGWPSGERLMMMTNNVVVLRYHNVTPAALFAEHSELYARVCAMGEAATRRLAALQKLWFWACSSYNRAQLVECGAPLSRCSVLPPFHAIERMAGVPADMSLAKRLDGAGGKLLCVSAIKPHKGHLRALRILLEYCRLYDPRARLVIAGTTDEWLSAYVQALHDEAARLGLADNVIFAENISQAQLHGLYLSADVFLCVSEHEGFGVPLVEAMYFGVPVVAWGRTAVPETLGDAGIVLWEYDDTAFATAIRDIVQDRERASVIVEAGHRRYERCFQPRVVERRLIAILEEVLAGCGRAQHTKTTAADWS